MAKAGKSISDCGWKRACGIVLFRGDANKTGEDHTTACHIGVMFAKKLAKLSREGTFIPKNPMS
jgi:hypothetical protein